ncbi:MAG: hypothetical protein DLM61_22380, partial [Pseudonocardiales bacterium]
RRRGRRDSRASLRAAEPGLRLRAGLPIQQTRPRVQIARFVQDQAAFSLDWAQSAEGDGGTQGEARIEEPLIRNLLAELQRLTGLDTTYVTRIDTAAETQHITHARNTAMLDIPEGLTVNWSDTICRRALDQGINYTDDVPTVFSDSQAATNLGLQTYVTVPLTSTDGILEGTLCGASCSRVALGEETVRVMEHFATLISQANKDSTSAAADGADPSAGVVTPAPSRP